MYNRKFSRRSQRTCGLSCAPFLPQEHWNHEFEFHLGRMNMSPRFCCFVWTDRSCDKRICVQDMLPHVYKRNSDTSKRGCSVTDRLDIQLDRLIILD